MIFGMPRALFPALAAHRFGGGARTVGYLYTALAAGGLHRHRLRRLVQPHQAPGPGGPGRRRGLGRGRGRLRPGRLADPGPARARGLPERPTPSAPSSAASSCRPRPRTPCAAGCRASSPSSSPVARGWATSSPAPPRRCSACPEPSSAAGSRCWSASRCWRRPCPASGATSRDLHAGAPVPAHGIAGADQIRRPDALRRWQRPSTGQTQLCPAALGDGAHLTKRSLISRGTRAGAARWYPNAAREGSPSRSGGCARG